MRRTAQCAKYILASLTLLALLHSGSEAMAQDSGSLRGLLLSIHEHPSLEAVAAATSDPVTELRSIVNDDAELMLVRRRAVLMLGHYPANRVESFLVSLLESNDGELRRASAMSLSRLLAESQEQLTGVIGTLLDNEDPLDREIAVMVLSRSSDPRARQMLERRRIVERHRAVVDALRRALHP